MSLATVPPAGGAAGELARRGGEPTLTPQLGGPVGAWLAYLIMGILVCGMMYSLVSAAAAVAWALADPPGRDVRVACGCGPADLRTCFAPNVGGFIEMGTRYVDPAFGFMMGT